MLKSYTRIPRVVSEPVQGLRFYGNASMSLAPDHGKYPNPRGRVDVCHDELDLNSDPRLLTEINGHRNSTPPDIKLAGGIEFCGHICLNTRRIMVDTYASLR